MRQWRGALVLTFFLATCVSAVDSWPQFRGPGSSGHADDADLPLKWSEKENVTWKTAIHDKGWSSPVAADGQVWLTTAPKEGRELFAICVDPTTGKIVYDLKLADIPNPQYCIPFNSYASPTPVIDGERVIVTFGAPLTACLDRKSGKVIWERRDLACNHYRSAASSPATFRNLLIMHFDGSDQQYVIALDKDTGKTVWKTNRSIDFKDLDRDGKPQTEGDLRKAFSTPVVIEIDGKPVLLSLGSKAFYAYDPLTGTEFWRTEERGSHSGSPTPLFGQGLIFTCTGLARGDLWAIRPGGSGVVTETHRVWKVTRNVPTRCSPILVDDLIYMVDDGGIVSCLESKSGSEVWRSRIPGGYSASPIHAKGRIYFFGENGATTVIQVGREFKVLAENKLDDGCMGSPAVAGNALFVRTKTHLYRVEGK